MAEINPPGFMQARNDHSAEVLRSAHTSLMGGHPLGGGFATRGGVHPEHGNRLAVTQTGSPTMAVVVRQGTVFIQGTEGGNQGAYVCKNDADKTIAVAAAPGPGLNRIDIVQARVRDQTYSGVNNDWVLEVKTGTPAGSPVAPNADANGMAIALIQVNSGVTSINTGNITWVAPYANGLGGYMEVPNLFYLPPSGTIRPGQRAHQLNDDVSKIWNGTAGVWEVVPTIREGTYTPSVPSGFNFGATGTRNGYYKVIPSIRMIHFSAVFTFNGAGSTVPAGPTFQLDVPPGFPTADFCSGIGYYDWGLRAMWWRGVPGGAQVQVRTSDNGVLTNGFTPGFSHMEYNGWYRY
jgi:hypothetical protein